MLSALPPSLPLCSAPPPADEDLLEQELRAGVLKPSYVLIRCGRAAAPAAAVLCCMLLAPYGWLADTILPPPASAQRPSPFCRTSIPTGTASCGPSCWPSGARTRSRTCSPRSPVRGVAVPRGCQRAAEAGSWWQLPSAYACAHRPSPRPRPHPRLNLPPAGAGASKPHHLVDANGVVLGYSHFGMLASARWIKHRLSARLEAALADNPGARASCAAALWLALPLSTALPCLTRCALLCLSNRRLLAPRDRPLFGRRHSSAADHDAARGRRRVCRRLVRRRRLPLVHDARTGAGENKGGAACCC